MSDPGEGDFDDIFGDEDFTKFFGHQNNLERTFREYVRSMIESLKKGQLQGKSELTPIEKPGIRGYIFHGVFGTPGAFEEEGTPELGSETRKNEGNLAFPETDKGEPREPVVEISTTANEFIAVVEMPGVEEQDIRVLPGDGLIDVNAMNFKAIEIDLPANADNSKMSKTFKNGILEIKVPLSRAKLEDSSVKFGVA